MPGARAGRSRRRSAGSPRTWVTAPRTSRHRGSASAAQRWHSSRAHGCRVPALSDPAAPVRRVLVVDDEPAIRELLSMICAYEGWDVRTAGTGEAGLGAVRADPPDVVLLDRMLPDLDGLTVLRGIRDSSPAVPVIMVTA